MTKPDRIFTISAILLSVAYGLLRLWGMADSCLWFDEIFGVHAAEHAFDSMLWFVAADLIHPPLFYVVLKGWIALGGDSVFWLRFLSVFFSVVSLAPFLLLCKELKLSFTARTIALAFFAANGSLIKYAQEVRMYSLLLFLSLVSTWLFARFFYRGKNIWILTLVNILLVYTHYFGWLVVASQVAAILVFQRIKIRHVLIMSGVLLITYVPWIWAIAQAAGAGADVEQNIGWIERPGIVAVFELAIDLVEPFYFQTSSILASSIYLVVVPLLLIVAAAKFNYLWNWKHVSERSAVMLLGVIAAVPLIMSLVLSWTLPVSIWGSRHLIVVFPSAMILIGIAMDAVRPEILKKILVSAASLLFAVAFTFRFTAATDEPIWCTWERQAQNVSANEPQTVYVFEDLVAYHFWFATRERSNVQVIKVNGMPEIKEDKAYFLPRGFNGVKLTGPDGMDGAKFWVAFRDMQWNEKHPPLNMLLENGFRLGMPHQVDAGRSKSFLVEVRK